MQQLVLPGGAAAGKRRRVHKQHFAVFCRHGIHQHGVSAEGIGLGEHLPGRDTAQNGLGAPQVQIFDVDTAAQHHTHFVDAASGVEDDLMAGKGLGAQLAGLGQGVPLGGGQPAKERRCNVFHKKPRFVVITTEGMV